MTTDVEDTITITGITDDIFVNVLSYCYNVISFLNSQLLSSLNELNKQIDELNMQNNRLNVKLKKEHLKQKKFDKIVLFESSVENMMFVLMNSLEICNQLIIHVSSVDIASIKLLKGIVSTYLDYNKLIFEEYININDINNWSRDNFEDMNSKMADRSTSDGMTTFNRKSYTRCTMIKVLRQLISLYRRLLSNNSLGLNNVSSYFNLSGQVQQSRSIIDLLSGILEDISYFIKYYHRYYIIVSIEEIHFKKDNESRKYSNELESEIIKLVYRGDDLTADIHVYKPASITNEILYLTNELTSVIYSVKYILCGCSMSDGLVSKLDTLNTSKPENSIIDDFTNSDGVFNFEYLNFLNDHFPLLYAVLAAVEALATRNLTILRLTNKFYRVNKQPEDILESNNNKLFQYFHECFNNKGDSNSWNNSKDIDVENQIGDNQLMTVSWQCVSELKVIKDSIIAILFYNKAHDFSINVFKELFEDISTAHDIYTYQFIQFSQFYSQSSLIIWQIIEIVFEINPPISLHQVKLHD